MDISLFVVFFAFSLILLLLTFFKKQVIVGIFTGISFILLGLLAWNGLEYVQSTSVVATDFDTTTITNNYAAWNHTIGSTGFTYTSVLGSFFILFGLFVLLVSGVMAFSGKKHLDFDFSGDSGVDDVGE